MGQLRSVHSAHESDFAPAWGTFGVIILETSDGAYSEQQQQTLIPSAAKHEGAISAEPTHGITMQWHVSVNARACAMEGAHYM